MTRPDDRLTLAAESCWRGRWTDFRLRVLNLLIDALDRAGPPRKPGTGLPPAPEAVAAELRRLAADLAALANKIVPLPGPR